MVRRLDARAADFAGAFDTLLSAKRETDEDVSAAVRAIIADVRTRGDDALIDYSDRFDKVQLTAATLAPLASGYRGRRGAMQPRKRWPRSTSRPSGSRIITAASFPPTLYIRTPSAPSSAGAGRRWTASGFMFRAARPVIRAPY